jgi:hypothetical protein
MTNVHNYISNFLRSCNKKVITIVQLAVVASLLCTLGITLSVFATQAHAAGCKPVEGGNSQIASRYGSNWHTIANVNDIANTDLLYIHQEVCISNTHVATKHVAIKHTVVKRVAAKHVAIKHKVAIKHVVRAINSAPAQTTQPNVTANSAPTQTTQPNSTSNSAPTQATQPNVASGDVNGLINEIFGPYAASAKNVAMCESGMNPNAKNPSSDASGVFQILYPSTWDTTSQASQSPYNAQANVTAAHDIFVRDGYSWREWSCQP